MEIQVVSHRDRPEFSGRLSELEGESFPEFLLHDGFDECRPHLLAEFALYQLYVIDPDGGNLLGAANALPYFSQAGEPLPKFQQLLTAAPEQFRQDIRPNVLCPVQAMVVDDARGSGVSERIISAYKDLASRMALKQSVSRSDPRSNLFIPWRQYSAISPGRGRTAKNSIPGCACRSAQARNLRKSLTIQPLLRPPFPTGILDRDKVSRKW